MSKEGGNNSGSNKAGGISGKLIYFPGCEKPPGVKIRIIEDVLPLYEALAQIGEGIRVGAGARIVMESEKDRIKGEIGLVFDCMIHLHARSLMQGKERQDVRIIQVHERIRKSLPLALFLMETLDAIFPKVLEKGDAGSLSLLAAFQERVGAFLAREYYLKPPEQSAREYADEMEPMISALMKSCSIEGRPLPLDSMPQRYDDAINLLIREKIEMLEAYQRI